VAEPNALEAVDTEALPAVLEQLALFESNVAALRTALLARQQ
jgi:hypothetical protein